MTSTTELTPRDWLLLLFLGSPRSLDRVRVQKAMFLFSQRTKAPEEQKYSFQPYTYGPFSFALYPDLSELVHKKLLYAEPIAWRQSPEYSLTAKGEVAVLKLAQRAPVKRLALLHEMRAYVLKRDFNQLLKDVYRLYPDYATRSVFRS